MGFLDLLQEINRDRDQRVEDEIRETYKNDPTKMQEELDRHRRRLAAFRKEPPPVEIDLNKMTDVEMEDLRDHTKLEIESLESKAAMLRNLVERQKQKQQNTVSRGGFWSAVGEMLADALSNAGPIEEVILEKRKLLARLENRLRTPLALPPSSSAQRLKILDEIDRLTQEMNEQIQKRPHMERDIKMMYQKFIDDERKKI